MSRYTGRSLQSGPWPWWMRSRPRKHRLRARPQLLSSPQPRCPMSNAEVLTLSAEGEAGSPVTSQLRRAVVCAGTGCMANGSMKVYEQFKSEMAKSGLDVVLELRAEAEDDEVRLSKSGCPVSY